MRHVSEHVHHVRRHAIVRVAVVAASLLAGFMTAFVTGCTPVVTVRAEAASEIVTHVDTRIALRGDPDFDPSQLQRDQRARYDQLWDEINDPANLRDIVDYARSDDTYTYSRELYSHIQAVLIVFRLTGDLALLDYVDTLAEHMRDQLADGWRGTRDGTDGTTDGFLNWVDRRTSTTAHRGKDTWRANDLGAHALVATIAYALDSNRDLTSPTGRDYAAHADFWEDYLVNHFEAKWREREGVPTGFPIMTMQHTTTHYKWLAWHYYMGQLTGDVGYMDEAVRMAERQWAEHFPVDTPSGTAYVWARSLTSGTQSNVLHPTTYARHVYGLSVDFHFEGFHGWASSANMIRFARTFTEYIIDSDDPIANGMAADVGGEQRQLRLRSERGWSRLDLARYRDSNFALIGAWDATGQIRAITDSVQTMFAADDTTRLAAAQFIDSWLSPRSNGVAARR